MAGLRLINPMSTLSLERIAPLAHVVAHISAELATLKLVLVARKVAALCPLPAWQIVRSFWPAEFVVCFVIAVPSIFGFTARGGDQDCQHEGNRQRNHGS